MIEEYFIALKYTGDYLIVDFEANTYEECMTFIQRDAECVRDCFESREAYNEVVEQDKHFSYWQIEKRFRLKQEK